MASDSDTRKQSQAEDIKDYVEDIQIEQGSSVVSAQPRQFVVSVEEKRLVRKLDMRIMPILSMVYLFACK